MCYSLSSIIIKYSIGKGGIIIKYSETSGKRSAKLRGFMGRLQGSNNRGPLPSRGSYTSTRFLKELLHTIFKLRYMKFRVVLKSFSDTPNCVV